MRRFSPLVALLLVAAPLHAQNDTSWVHRSGIYEIFVRDFSPQGTLRGVMAGLDRVQAVDANVIWLMPIYPVGVENHKGTLGSPYAVRDYHAINPAFGTPDDFRALVRSIHARGMKIILDWVPNHTAWDNVWTREHPDYYVRDDHGNLTVPRDDQGHLTDWTDVAQLNYQNPALRQAMIDAMRWWLTEYDIDGFRVDAAGFVPDAFWQEAVPAVRAAVPKRILMLAEWGDLKMHRFGFDLSYPWEAYAGLKAVWRGDSAATWVRGQVADAAAMPDHGMRLRFTTNHDETAWDQPPVTLFGGSAGARAAFVAMTLMPGRPLIYDGQEVEDAQKLRLFEHDTISWTRPGAAGATTFYQRVINLVRTASDVRDSAVTAIETTSPADIIAYRRGELIILVNTRARPARFDVRGAPLSLGNYGDVFTGQTQHDGTISLPAYGALVLRPEDR